MEVKFYNTLSGEVEALQPIHPDWIGLYSCGPTVYSYPHIGNARSFILSDLVRRTLEYAGYQVKQVINVTDVGEPVGGDDDHGQDKIERAATTEGKTAQEIAQFYYQAWREDLDALHVKTTDTTFPRASEHIAEQINLIERLEVKGHVYRTSDGLYFDTATYPPYPKLAHLDIKGLREGARVAVNTEKRHPTDFALWKFSRPDEARQQEWPSPWGVGYPGWHIECSAMSMKYLGEHFDIHTGGLDLLPTHHTNERAQSESATGEKFVSLWMHGGFLTVDGQKMSKSLGNIYRLIDLEKKGISPLAYRYWLLTASYRKIVNFTWEALQGAQTAYGKLKNIILDLRRKKEEEELTPNMKPTTYDPSKVNLNYRARFEGIINFDLNTSRSLALAWELIDDSSIPASEKLQALYDFDRVWGLGLSDQQEEKVPAEILTLAEAREKAREEKDWARSDELRTQITQAGFQVEDTDTGPKVRKS